MRHRESPEGQWNVNPAASVHEGEQRLSSGNSESQKADTIARRRPAHTQTPGGHTHSKVVPTRRGSSHLILGNINDTDPDVRAPLSNDSHRRTSDIPSAHTADVVLELLGRHGGSCGAPGTRGRAGRISVVYESRCVIGNGEEQTYFGTIYNVEDLAPPKSPALPI